MSNIKRNSGIELLRIICVILIICHHYSFHGGFLQFSYDDIGLNIIFIQMLNMFGKASCSVFALISGYFLINAKNDINYYKKIVNLIFEMFFYSVLILFIALLTRAVPISGVAVVKALFPIFWGNWYVIFYIILYLIVPFINPGLKAMNKKEYTLFLMLLLFIWCIVPTFTGTA